MVSTRAYVMPFPWWWFLSGGISRTMRRRWRVKELASSWIWLQSQQRFSCKGWMMSLMAPGERGKTRVAIKEKLLNSVILLMLLCPSLCPDTRKPCKGSQFFTKTVLSTHSTSQSSGQNLWCGTKEPNTSELRSTTSTGSSTTLWMWWRCWLPCCLFLSCWLSNVSDYVVGN